MYSWKKTSPCQATSLLGWEVDSSLGGILKINTDDSSWGNLGHASIGGIVRGNDGGTIFLFSIYKGQHYNNLMEALAI